MAGLQPGAPRPTEIKLHQKSRVLEIVFDDGKSFRLECELLWKEFLDRMAKEGASRKAAPAAGQSLPKHDWKKL